MKRLLFLLPILCLFSCEDPETSPPQSDVFSWNPAQIWPDIELPAVIPDAVLELETIPENALSVTVNDIGDGSILNSPLFQYFVFENGDYTNLERIDLTTSGEATERRVFFCPGGDCLFDAFYLKQVDYLVFSGIDFHSYVHENNDGVPYGETTKLFSSNSNTFHDCHWRNSKLGLRIYGDYNTVQYCSFTDKPEVGVDVGGATIFARDGEESRGNRIIYNEFRGMSDGAAVPWDDGGDGGSTPATVIAYNVSVVPESMHRQLIVHDDQGNAHTWITACAEDGYDFKNGAITDDPKDQSLFIGNVSIGHRPTDQICGGSGSSGVGWIFHRRARNWLIKGNLSFDDAHGCFVKGYNENPDAKDKVQNIQMEQNAFVQLGGHFPGGIDGYRESENDRLAIRVMCPTCFVTDNLVSGAKREVFIGSSKAIFDGNVFIDVEEPVWPEEVVEDVREVEVEVGISPVLGVEEGLKVGVLVGE